MTDKQKIPEMLEQALNLIKITFEIVGIEKIKNPLAKKRPRKKYWYNIKINVNGSVSTLQVGMHRNNRILPSKVWVVNRVLKHSTHSFYKVGRRFQRKLHAIKEISSNDKKSVT